MHTFSPSAIAATRGHSIGVTKPATEATMLGRLRSQRRSRKHLSAQQEERAISDILSKRVQRWNALLEHPVLVPVVVGWLPERDLLDPFPAREVAVAVRQARIESANQSDFSSRVAFGNARAALARKLARCDEKLSDEHWTSLVAFVSSACDRLDAGSVPRGWLDQVVAAQRRYVAARNEFLCSYLTLVERIAPRYCTPALPLSDQLQEGVIGLLRAVARFDPTRGARFATYASWWIRHYLVRALCDHSRTVRLPARVHRDSMRCRAIQAALRARLRREPSLEEVATEMCLRPKQVEAALSALQPTSPGRWDSNDSQPDEHDDVGAATALTGSLPAVDYALERHQLLVLAGEAFGDLTDMERDIIRRNFGLGGGRSWTLREVGERHNLSRERIRQLRNRALAKIREAIDPCTACA